MKEFVDFLGSQPPFDALDSQDLDALARTIEVEFFPAGTTIIVADGPRLEHLWLIRAGRVAVSDRGTVVDERDMGDTFGHLSLFSGWPPSFSVTAVEDTLCYRLPDPRQVIQHPERLQFRAYGGASNRMRTVQTAGVARRFGHEPRVALLAYSTFGFPRGERSDRVIEAVELLGKRGVDFEYDGEMAADVALDREKMKLYPFCRLSDVANVLIMPAIHSASISTKLLAQMGSVTVLGPLLVGLEKSIQIVPLGAKMSEIYNMAILAAYDINR